MVVLCMSLVNFSFRGHMEGLYLLKGLSANTLRLADDVYLGEEEQACLN